MNAVTDTPANFKQWVRDNQDRIKRASEQGKLPYFLRDNPEAWGKVLYPRKNEIRSDGYRGNIFARTLNNIQTELITRKFKDITTSENLKSIAEELFKTAVGNNVEITINDELIPLDVAKAHLTELLSIVKDYDIKQGKLTDIILGYKPEDEREHGNTEYTPSTSSKKIYLTGNIDTRDTITAERNSRCDKSRLHFSLASHEGGHLLQTLKYIDNIEGVAFKEKINHFYYDYIKEFEEAISKKDFAYAAKIMIGLRGHRCGSGEFMAECFQEYRNSSNPSKYAIIVGRIIDEYFKK